ncbi:MAG TPA: hypothetical protein VLC30_03675 [Pseudomonas sp.]|nr:hypothetical protein [Pseudomonas sp.]
MSSRSILIAVLGLTLNGCAVYDYEDDYDSRYYGGNGYSVQRYEAYPAYPVYPQGYRYAYPRHDGYSQRYYYNTRHADRYERDDRYGHQDWQNDHRGHAQAIPRSNAGRPVQWGSDGHKQHERDRGRRPQIAMPGAGKPSLQQVSRGHERSQEHRQGPRQNQSRARHGEPENGVRNSR